MIDELMTELHIDDSDEERQTLEVLLKDSEALIIESCSTSENIDKLKKDSLYPRAQKAVAYHMYVDRTMENSLSPGIQMLMVKLRAKYDE